MFEQNIRLDFGLIGKTILAILIGLMGGGVAVLAQAADGGAAASSAPAAATVTQSASPAAAPDGQPMAPVPAGKKAAKKKKVKPPKTTPVSIVQGTLTVDGWTGKARLNYDIADLKYLYVWVPGVGTALISNDSFPRSKSEPNAFSGNTLTVDADGHTIQLYSEKRLLRKPSPAFVYVDAGYNFPSTYPVMGYGAATQPPYAWPGAKSAQAEKGEVAEAPPLPKDLLPTLACVPTGSKAAGAPCPKPLASTSAQMPTASPSPAVAAH